MDENALEKYRHDLEFIRQAARQTERDFERMGYELSLPEHPSGFEILCAELSASIKTICNSSDNRLEAVLYHIDVPEKVLHPVNGCKNPDLTAKIILQRELIKVVIRKIYGSGTEK